jgi:phosphatidylglycerol:prolipoprotein diacylglycerol transferase
MLPYINFFEIEISTYGIMACIGIIIAVCVAVYYFSKFYDIKKEDVFYACIYATIGIGIGSKLLYLITDFSNLIQNISISNLIRILPKLLKSGFVFYGGLVGGILGILIYSKIYKISFEKLCMILIPVVPLFHFFGRIGCLLAGCCYGIEYIGIGNIVFNNSDLAPNGMPLFPVQIVESICNLIIFIIILMTYKKFKGTYKTIALYFNLYSIVRFILEFYRGDAQRGILLGISTSQWISIGIFIIGIFLFIYDNKQNHTSNKKNI